jgi:hypothetical protein
MRKKRLLKKEDIMTVKITISYTKKTRFGVAIEDTFQINLQEWIKLSPEEQEAKVKEKVLLEKESLVKFDVV